MLLRPLVAINRERRTDHSSWKKGYAAQIMRILTKSRIGELGGGVKAEPFQACVNYQLFGLCVTGFRIRSKVERRYEP